MDYSCARFRPKSVPDEWGQRFHQNATLLLAGVPSEIYYAVTFNRWIVSGNTRSVCFDFCVGSFRVNFNHQQMLHGTYGGEEGIPAIPGDCLVCGYYNIPVCQAIWIQLTLFLAPIIPTVFPVSKLCLVSPVTQGRPTDMIIKTITYYSHLNELPIFTPG